MKTKLIAIAFLLFTSALYAQKTAPSPGFRMQRPEETAFLNQLHNDLFNALPHTYKDWKTSKEDTFDALKYWCSDEGSWGKCLGWIPASIGKGDPYSLDWQVEFNMDQSQSAPLMVSAFKMITDYNNGQQIAASLKSTNKTKLVIFIVANIDANSSDVFTLSYCGKTPLQKIDLPVPATLAVKGIRSTDCPIMESGRVSMSGNYYDNALVFLGKPATAKKTVTTDDGITADSYGIAFDKARIGKLVVQNIVVKFKGDSADIDEAIKLIDWQKLSSLIGKP